MHIVADQKSSRDAFDMLKDHSVIDEDIARRLKAMVGFRTLLFMMTKTLI
ncbi:HepT-like ribonuclease domain-containing protein [Peribacillus frigoritolerans]